MIMLVCTTLGEWKMHDESLATTRILKYSREVSVILEFDRWARVVQIAGEGGGTESHYSKGEPFDCTPAPLARSLLHTERRKEAKEATARAKRINHSNANSQIPRDQSSLL